MDLPEDLPNLPQLPEVTRYGEEKNTEETEH
jgi:hypothetical protein